MLARSLLLVALSWAACGEDAPTSASPTDQATAEATPHASIDVDDPSTCAACHEAIVDEWGTSMHAQAHHDSDVVYAAMRRARMAREGEDLAGRCASCHGPRDPAHPESEIARTGVSCATCHNLSGVDTSDGHRGAAALTRAPDGTLRGPHGVDTPASPHPTGAAAPWLADGRTVCLACHGNLSNAQGVATCTTGAEYAERSDARPCTGCHMPMVERPNGTASERPSHRSHAFVGPHELWRSESSALMASSVTLTSTLADTTLRASLSNQSQHALPTGFPGRMVLARARGYDAAGAVVWQNFTDAPMQQDPDAVFNKVYVDAEGQPTMPPYGARMARDTRLEPGETRELSWTVPAGVVRAEISLIYRLLPPPAARALGIGDAPEAEPRPFLTVSAVRPGG